MTTDSPPAEFHTFRVCLKACLDNFFRVVSSQKSVATIGFLLSGIFLRREKEMMMLEGRVRHHSSLEGDDERGGNNNQVQPLENSQSADVASRHVPVEK